MGMFIMILISLFLIIFIIMSIFGLLDTIIDFKVKISMAKEWKQYKGDYVICHMSDDKELYYLYELNEDGYGANKYLETAIKFKNQNDAIQYLIKYYHAGLFVIKL